MNESGHFAPSQLLIQSPQQLHHSLNKSHGHFHLRYCGIDAPINHMQPAIYLHMLYV